MWKDIKGYEGLYQVSDDGQVRSLGVSYYIRPNCLVQKKGKVLLPELTKGYLRVQLRKDGYAKHYLVHRLVAEAFIPNPDNLATVNHKDENKVNNAVDNLEWMSNKDNILYGTGIKRRSISKQKAIRQLSLEGDLIKVWESAKTIQSELGINRSDICKCCKGRRKTAGGFKWEYDS